MTSILIKTPLEREFQKKVLSALKKLKNTFFFKKEAKAIGGIPDVIACVNGHFVALELKRSSKNHLSVLQEFTLMDILNAGGIGLPTYPENWGNIYEALEKLASGETHVQSKLQDLARGHFEKRANESSNIERLQKHKLSAKSCDSRERVR